MPMILNNVTTEDNYTVDVTAIFPALTHKINLVIANASVYVQWERVEATGRVVGAWSDEQFYVPGIASVIDPIGPVGGVRMRSAVTGEPAQVSARPA